MTKRIWAGLLALSMALTALPFGIYAEETAWEEETDASKETLDGGLDESAEEFADGLPDYIPEPETDVVDGAADDESADELSEQKESLTEEATPDLPDFIPEEEPLVLEEEEPQDVQTGDFVRVTPNTRVYLDIDETAGDEDDGELYDGNFVNEANVYVEQVRQDAQERTWLLVRYLYGEEEPNGEMAWTDTATVWTLAEETQPSDAADYDGLYADGTVKFLLPEIASEKKREKCRRELKILSTAFENIHAQDIFTLGERTAYLSNGEIFAVK